MRVLLALALLVAGWGVAQRCLPELRGDTDLGSLSQPASGRDAARYLRRAVELLEPVLPQLASAAAPLSPEDPDYETVRLLAQHRLLPAEWQPEALPVTVWREMLGRLAAWYGVSIAPTFAVPPTRWQLLSELSLLIARVGPSLKPVALVASDEHNRQRVAFWALIRNDSVYPRLIVVRPPFDRLRETVSLQRGVAAVLPYLSTCANEVRRYIFAPAPIARRLFLANNEARMVIVELEPSSLEPWYVPEGEELAYLTFEHAALDGYQRFAALFIGPGPSLPTVLRLLPQLRTNMGPREIIDFVMSP
ncbi:MAG: hypothetical protein KGZ60_09590 [Truepera sp.]|nr:hypothetical protein [Truepera sp.]